MNSRGIWVFPIRCYISFMREIRSRRLGAIDRRNRNDDTAMNITALSAARTMCRERAWTISNLELQKLLYITQMMHLGRSKGETPLFDAHFEAWDLGPVLPGVYQRAKAFGDKPVADVFRIADFAEGEELKLIQDVSAAFKNHTPFELVNLTHDEKGAWAKYYQPGVRGIIIPKEDIVREYQNRIKRS